MGGKLVRDRIPEIIRQQGRNPVVRTLDESSYVEALREKLKEEVAEYTESGSVDELADVLEVIHELLKVHQVTMTEIDEIRSRKREERGGFSRRMFLETDPIDLTGGGTE